MLWTSPSPPWQPPRPRSAGTSSPRSCAPVASSTPRPRRPCTSKRSLPTRPNPRTCDGDGQDRGLLPATGDARSRPAGQAEPRRATRVHGRRPRWCRDGKTKVAAGERGGNEVRRKEEGVGFAESPSRRHSPNRPRTRLRTSWPGRQLQPTGYNLLVAQ